MNRLVRVVAAVVFVLVAATACGGDAEPSQVPVNAQGFPIDWPVAVPPGNVNGCSNGTVSQEDSLFSVVMCLPDEPDPFTASENYLAALEGDGFAEREPGAFITQQATFLEGNGIEIYFQLIGNEATVVLIKPAT